MKIVEIDGDTTTLRFGHTLWQIACIEERPFVRGHGGCLLIEAFPLRRRSNHDVPYHWLGAAADDMHKNCAELW